MSLQPPTAKPLDASHRAPSAGRTGGAVLFEAACASCHGAAAPMSTNGDRPSLGQGTAVNADSPRNMIRVILDGINWNGSAAAHFMPPFAQTFTDAQIAELASYTRERYSARAPWPLLDAAAVARIRKESRQP
jgi:mono/diheme cytochrome c family protein